MKDTQQSNAKPTPFETSFIQMLATGDGGDPCIDRIAEKYLQDFLHAVAPEKQWSLVVGTNTVAWGSRVARLLRLLREQKHVPREISPDGLENTKSQIVSVLVNGWAFATTRSEEETLLGAITSLPEHMAELVTAALRKVLETNCLEDARKADQLACLMEHCARDDASLWVKYELGRAAIKVYMRYVHEDAVPSALQALLKGPVWEQACRRAEVTG